MDIIKFKVLEDGTIKTETDKVSMPNHANAEMFLRNVAALAGGTVTSSFKGRSLHGALHAHASDGHVHAGHGADHSH